MRTIAITTPGFYPGEADAITRHLLDGDCWRVHIRKPDADPGALHALIEEIPASLRPRLTIHYNHDIAGEYGLGGIHLSRRAPLPPRQWQGLVSRSLHTLSEVRTLSGCHYAFLSPIFPSISKPGYTPSIPHDDITALLRSRPDGSIPVFALGGVTPESMPQLAAMGFGGAAMLGAAWRPCVSPSRFRLQFITHATPRYTVTQGARMALEGGCRWIQLRMKDATQADLLLAGREIAAMCRDFKATFIIDDHVELVHTLGADGVHLGLTDMPVPEARTLLGPRKIIGATANTLQHMVSAADAGADYIGLGPFRFTRTKTNLSPILGLQGYRDLITRFGARLPVVAIGGITPSDIPTLLPTGISGVAVSSAILSDPDPAALTATLLNSLSHITPPTTC